MKMIEELQKQLDDAKMRIEEIENGLNRMKAENKKNRYPMTSVKIDLWCNISNNILVNGLSLDKKYLTFTALVETCREWNRIDGFEPNWGVDTEIKYGIIYHTKRILVKSFSYTSLPLYFNSQETAQLFLDTFNAEIEQVKELI